MKPKVYSDKVLTVEDKANIIQMYKDGYKQAEIAAAYGKHFSSIRHILVESEVLYDGGVALKEKARTREYANTSNSVRSLLSSAILPADIEDMKRQIKVGDHIAIRSLKSGESMNSSGGLVGHKCVAEVVNVDHPRFVGVKLPNNGATEYFLWSDFVMAVRKAQKQEVTA